MTRDFSSILRACAILSIALHNLLHTPEMGYAQECEMSFDVTRSFYLFDLLSHPQASVVLDLISFIGWSGVSVFVFLSGYGLAKKYGNLKIHFCSYLKHSYLKLLLLALPAVFIVIPFYLLEGQYKLAASSIISLTMLHNAIPSSIAKIYSILPPYWYLGLTFELYIIWGAIHKRLTNRILLTWGG